MLLNILSIPFKLPSWVISLLVARHVTHIVLNPSSIPEQRSVHLAKVNENLSDDVVLINFKKKPKVKWINDLLLKFTHIFPLLLLFAPQLRSRHFYHQASHKDDVNKLLAEIDNLLTGKSTKKYCEGRTFDWSHIHLKGIEFLDAKMRVYLYEQLDKKYGPESYTDSHSTRIEFFTLKTSDQAEIDSIEVMGPDEKLKPIAERKFVITCLARDQNYVNWLKDLNYTATHLNATAISFNYRGVDLSRGVVWTEDDMVQDVLAQVERLVALGAKPENICLDGMCLAGAIVTLAAAELHRQNIKVKLNNERSFRSLPHLLFGYIAPELQTTNWFNPLNYLRFVAAGLAYVIFTPILWLGGWYTNAEKAWDKIPAKDKIYSHVRDENLQIYDGVINDRFSSIASVVDSQINAIIEKLHKNVPLTEKETNIFAEYSESDQVRFTPSEAIKLSDKYRGPHFISRRDLVVELGHQEPYTNHDYFLNKLKDKFVLDKLLKESMLNPEISLEPSLTSFSEKPLILACSGGAGHISAAKGIIGGLQKKNPNVVITQHEPLLYREHKFTFTAFMIRLGIWSGSIPVIGYVVNKIAHLVGAPAMPNYKVFWSQMSQIKKSETENIEGKKQGIKRPYVDVLLDLFPPGYEFTAYNNAAHLSLTAKETSAISTYKGSVENYNHYAVFKNVLRHLVSSAKSGSPYTQIISTQALSIKSICDAVLYYNNTFLPQYNAKHQTVYPAISIAQYLTDLPSLGCAHFMDNLEDLSIEQRKLIELYAVYISKPIKAAYFSGEHGFKAVYDVDPKQNPMVRAAFKDKNLSDYTNLEKSQKLFYKNEVTPLIECLDTDRRPYRDINAGDKVASIMIGSLAANASVDYIESLLKANYNHIFVFGGSNEEILKRINTLILKYPVSEQAKIKQRIICLGNQTDVEMAPIFTRSNCVVIRGGGLSVMEQMAMPLTKDKIVLMHHEDSDDEQLTSGLSWEDSNTDRLIEYLTEQEAFSVKVSPKLCERALVAGQRFYAKPHDSSVQDEEVLRDVAQVEVSSELATNRPKRDSKLLAPKTHGFFSQTKVTEEPVLQEELEIQSSASAAA